MLHTDPATVHDTGFLTSGDGIRLFWQGVQPAREAKAAVALVHGFNSSSDYLLPLMRRMAQDGLACYAIDYRGHGRSEGVKCHVFRFREYLEDLRALCRHVSERSGDGRLFLFGNSLGGLIASHYGLVASERLRGAVLTAPFFVPAFRVPRLLDLCGRAVSAVCPTFPVPRDPRVPPAVTLRWWTETVAAQQVFRRRAEKFTLPVLILHGQQDTVACPSGARRLFERLGSRDKAFRLMPQARHDDLDPSCGSGWWSEVCEWLTCRAAGRTSGMQH